MDIVVRDALKILSSNLDAVGLRHAGRIWGLISKFVMLDRFAETLGCAEFNPGLFIPRKVCDVDYFGTAARVSVFLQTALLSTMIFRF